MEIKIKHPNLHLLGLSILVAIYLYFIFMFLTAYYHPTKSTVLQINKWGESDVEFVVLMLTLPLVLSTIFLMYKIICNKKNGSEH